MRRRYMLGVAVVILFIAPTLSARFQRMAIARGSYRVAPKSSSRVPAYCVDYTRKAPSRNVPLKELLDGAENARVVTPTRRMSLAEALAEGLLSITGENHRLDELFESPLIARELAKAPPQERAEFELMRRLWESMSPSERRQLEAELAEELGGDHTAVRFINNSKEEVRIELVEDLQAGKDKEPPARLTTNLADKPKPQQVWTERGRDQQSMLKQLGYYDGKIDGILGPQSERAIKAFQEANGFPASGAFDATTETRLLEQFRMSALNDANKSVQTVIIERQRGQELSYRLTSPAGTRTYPSLEAVGKDLVSSISPERGALYIDAVGFEGKEVDGLATGLRLQLPSDSPISIKPIRRATPAALTHDLVLTPGARIVSTERVAAGAKAILGVEVPHQGRIRRLVIEITTKVAEWLDFALTRLTQLLSGDSKLSLAEAGARVRRELREQYPEMSDDDFRMFIVEQAAATEIVEALQSWDPAA